MSTKKRKTQQAKRALEIENLSKMQEDCSDIFTNFFNYEVPSELVSVIFSFSPKNKNFLDTVVQYVKIFIYWHYRLGSK